MAKNNLEECISSLIMNIPIDKVKKNTIDYLSAFPGFFTPFKNGRDVATSLIIPVIVPLALGSITALIATISTLSGALCLASLVIAGIGAALPEQTHLRNNALTIATLAGIFAVIGPIVSVILALTSLIATSVAVTYLLTRTGISINKAFKSYFPVINEDHSDSEVEDKSVVAPTFTGLI